jgi:hypothetical protein
MCRNHVAIWFPTAKIRLTSSKSLIFNAIADAFT